MMDLLMAAVLLGSFGLVWLLVRWCDVQVEQE